MSRICRGAGDDVNKIETGAFAFRIPEQTRTQKKDLCEDPSRAEW
jgi:hypothetical protein